MNRKLLISAALLAVFSASEASAQVVIQMDQVTCKQYMAADPDTQAIIGSWLSGYYSASKNLNVFQSIYFKRNKEKGLAYCKKHKDAPLMGAMEKIAH
jgi:acid stress chaperone HdeB